MFNYLKTDNGKVTIKVLATLLAVTLTFANFILLGSYLGKANVSYAADDTSTNNDNVKFSVYLDETKTVKELIADFNSTELKLYVYVGVENQGTLENAKITLEDTNFNLKDKEKQTEISLGTIQAGSKIEQAYEIVAKKDTSFNLDLLNKQSKIKLTGTYKGSNKSNVTEEEINSTKNVTIRLNALDKINETDNPKHKSEISQEIITNKVYKIGESNKRVVQQLVTSNIVENSYPIKTTYIESLAPALGETYPESVKVATYGTAATNGKYLDFGEKSENKAGSYEYDTTSHTVKITVDNNPDSNNNISWEKGVADTFVITYIYPETATAENISTKVTNKITMYTYVKNDDGTYSDGNFASKENTVTNSFGEIELEPTISVSTPEQLYKGNMKIGQPTTFRIAWTAGISYKDLANSILLTNQTLNENNLLKDSFNAEAGTDATTYFKSTYINKEEMKEVLGDLGTVKISGIKDATTEIGTINSQTEVETLNGVDYYKITYPADVETITVETSTPVKEGVLSLIHQKELVSNDSIKTNLDKITALKTSAAVSFNQGENPIAISSAYSSINMLNTQNSATIGADKTTLSTTQANTVKFTVTLSENELANELYKNPTIKIELPSYITKAELGEVQLINENGLAVGSKTVDGNTINIKLSGETTAYTNTNPQLNITATLTTNNLMPSTAEDAKLTVINENNETPATAKVSLTAEAEQGILTATTVTAYNGTNPALTSYKNDVKTAVLATGAEEGAKPHITGTLVNNTSSDLTNITVIGKINGEDSNISATISNVTGGTVTYTTDADVKADSNWVDQMPEGATGYKIVIASLASKQTTTFAYDLQLPANMEINKSMDITYTVINGASTVIAPIVTLQTPQETKLELTVTPTAQNNAVVYEGQKLTYNVTVKNTGNNTAKNITVTNTVPEGTTLVSGSSSAWTIDALEAGKEVAKTMEVTVNNLAEGETTKDITVTTTVEQAYLKEAITNTIKNTVNKAKISVSVKDGYNDGEEIGETISVFEGEEIKYKTYIYNTSGTDLTNVELTVDIPEGTEKNYDKLFVGNSEEYSFGTLENGKIKYNIEKLNKDDYLYIITSFKASNLPNSLKEKDVKFKLVVKADSMGEYIHERTDEVVKSSIKLSQTSVNTTNEERNENVLSGDVLEYMIFIENDTNYPEEILFNGELTGPIDITTIKYKIDGETEYKELTSLYLNEVLDANKKLNIIITAKVIDTVSDTDLIIKNLVNVCIQTEVGNVNELTDTVEYTLKALSTDPDDPTNPDDPTPVDPSSTYTLSGKTWLDENKDGKLDEQEELLKGISVTIKDAITGEFLKDSNNNLITSTTDDKGEYKFKDLKPGKYILVFDCDTKTYGVTVSNGDSVAVATTEDGKTVIKTDTLELKNKDITNLNIGLIKNPKFDLQLDKYVTKITVQNVDGTTTYNYDKSQLAKVEISSKKMASSVVLVEYTIDVTNKGEVAGYAKSLVDYVSKEYNFASELNTSWYQGTDNNLYCAELAEEIIKPGETKSVKLVLTKTMTTTNTGLISNTAEIGEDFNEFALSDVNSTPGNNEQKENDMSGADVLISVKTGGVMLYIGIIIASMLILRWRNLLSE